MEAPNPNTFASGLGAALKFEELDPKVLDQSVSDVMDQPFPVVEANQPVESVAKLLSKSNRAVLMRKDGMMQGIVTRFDVLEYLMHR